MSRHSRLTVLVWASLSSFFAGRRWLFGPSSVLGLSCVVLRSRSGRVFVMAVWSFRSRRWFWRFHNFPCEEL